MWENIEITELDGIYNQFNQLITSQCCFCGNQASHLLNRTSLMSGKSYSDRICSNCLQDWQC